MKRLKWLSLKHQVWWSLYLKERKKFKHRIIFCVPLDLLSPPLVCSVHLHYTLTRPPPKWECLQAFIIIMPIYIMANNIIMPIIFPSSSNGISYRISVLSKLSEESWWLTSHFLHAYLNFVSFVDLYVKCQCVILTYDPLSWKWMWWCLHLLTDETLLSAFWKTFQFIIQLAQLKSSLLDWQLFNFSSTGFIYAVLLFPGGKCIHFLWRSVYVSGSNF